mmetsp:Transcript_118299/g.341991  ORF Transcript_118299/g.341991 Transcript_118299/m.341991 type:complete len:80 (+) Transcript_118299:1186-1425(+)
MDTVVAAPSAASRCCCSATSRRITGGLSLAAAGHLSVMAKQRLRAVAEWRGAKWKRWLSNALDFLDLAALGREDRPAAW